MAWPTFWRALQSRVSTPRGGAADKAQLSESRAAGPRPRELQQDLDASILLNSQEPFAVSVDLRDDCKVSMSPLPKNLVDSNGGDARRALLSKAHRTAHPTDRETFSQEVPKATVTSCYDVEYPRAISL